MTKVLIADDHPVVRRGLMALLNEEPEFEMTDETADGLEVLMKIPSIQYDVLVLDLMMPYMDGLKRIAQLKLESPTLAVLVLSTNPEEFYGLRSHKLGASGYLSKECAPEQLVSAIRLAAKGQIYLSQNMAEILALNFIGRSPAMWSSNLSFREYQVMAMIAEGKSIKQIPTELSINA